MRTAIRARCWATLALAGMCWLTPARAGEGPKEGARANLTEGVVEATLEGTNFCVACALKSRLGAGAQCGTLGHKHAFKVSRAVDPNGKDLPDAKGWVLHYLDTDRSQELITKHHGEKLKISGKIYPAERVLEAESFEKLVPLKP